MTLVQRWRRGRDRYRPAGEVINTSAYEVVALPHDAIPRRFVRQHHYSGSWPAARFRFGLYRRDALAGVAVFSHPVNDRVLTSVFPGEAKESVELGRFVLLDDVPGNGETWFLARTFELLRRESLVGVLSFSDPMPRKATDGRVVFRGHLGVIYQAFNGRYLGRGTSRTLRILPDGEVMSDRAIQKIRAKEQGWQYAVELLERAGAPSPDGDLRVWLQTWLPRVTTTVKHPGNHKYGWPLRRFRWDAAALPYPKQLEGVS